MQSIDLIRENLERRDRVELDGAVREVRLPERFDALRFTPDRIWGVQRDEVDAASVAWIELPEVR